MKRIVAITAIALLFVLSALGQKPSPTPAQPDDSSVVKISTSLIQLDVTVTDKDGKIITDLRPEEVEIYENGDKQKITNFSFISNGTEIREQATTTKKKGPVLPPARVKLEKVRRTIALVVDDLTLSFESVYYVRRALRKFVDEQMQDGDLVAVIRTGAGIGALQQFTNDKRQLYAAIERVRWNGLGSGNVGAFAPLEAKPPRTGFERPADVGERTAEGIDRENQAFRESIFATGTLGAVNYVVRGMEKLPGRKSILLLSDGFKLFTEDAEGFRETGRVMDAVRALIDKANRASVVIYTMDGRGLQTTGFTAQDNTTNWSRREIAKAMSDRRDRLADTQAGLEFLAEQTGGIAITNSNDLSGGIRKILDDQSYYLVGYEPDGDTFDPKTRRFNNVVVKVTRPGLRVRYRSGFFSFSDEEITPPIQTPTQRLLEALTSPFSINDISLRLNALFYDSGKESFLRSLLHIQTRDLTFQDLPDGSKKASFDIIAVGFGDNGTVVDQTSKRFTLTLNKDLYARSLESGLVYDFIFPVKKPGAYQLRVAIRDQSGNKVGSANQFVEVPNLKKNRLVLSGAVLENITFAEYQKRVKGDTSDLKSDPLTDTSLRQFKPGTVLNLGFDIYNADLVAGKGQITYRTRIYRDGKIYFEGDEKPLPSQPGMAPESLAFTQSLVLGTEMPAGDYLLEVVVTDGKGGKGKTAAQFIQFEIVNP